MALGIARACNKNLGRQKPQSSGLGLQLCLDRLPLVGVAACTELMGG